MKKQKLFSFCAGIVLSFLMLLAGCTSGSDQPNSITVPPAATIQPEFVPEGVHSLIYGETASEPVSIHTDLQTEVLRRTYKTPHRKASGTSELSRPEGLTLNWSSWADSIGHASSYTVRLSENQDFSSYKEFTVSEESIVIYNLKIGTEYFWDVTAGEIKGEVSSFKTSDVIIRNIYVDGITNFRDIGGYDVAGGGNVRQGMIYRCGRLNKSKTDEVEVEITDAGKETMLNDLGIKSEIDLRRVDNGEVGGITASVLGDEVNYYSVPMEFAPTEFDGDALKANADMIKYLFSILADENNYPLCFHCDIGTDRTGMVAYLVNGLLGVKEDDLYYDYVFSNLGYIRGIRTYEKLMATPYIQSIAAKEGKNLSEKIYISLIEIGVEPQDIEAVRSILLENN